MVREQDDKAQKALRACSPPEQSRRVLLFHFPRPVMSFRAAIRAWLGIEPPSTASIVVNLNSEAFMSALTDAVSQINAAADAAVARITEAGNTNTAQAAQITDLTNQVATLKSEADAATTALTDKAKALAAATTPAA